jgi:hypothetical protein
VELVEMSPEWHRIMPVEEHKTAADGKADAAVDEGGTFLFAGECPSVEYIFGVLVFVCHGKMEAFRLAADGR